MMPPIFLKNAAALISPYGRSSTTPTNTLRTLYSGMNTIGSSHDPAILMGGVVFLTGLVA